MAESNKENIVQISMKKRILIIIYDLILCFACLLFVDATFVTIINGGTEAIGSKSSNVLSVINALVILFYFVGFWYYKQTPAMKIWRVAMVPFGYKGSEYFTTKDKHTFRISFPTLLIRFFVSLFSLGLSVIYGFFNKGICLHDSLSKTYLIPVKSTKKSSK